MNKMFLIALTFLMTLPAFAAVTTFTCELEKVPKQFITFKMTDVGTAKMNYLNSDPNDDYSPVFLTRSNNDKVIRLVDTLNGQGGDLRFDNTRLSFFGDSAGIDFAYLVLFRNTGFRNGFVRIEFDNGEDKDYSKINCVLR